MRLAPFYAHALVFGLSLVIAGCGDDLGSTSHDAPADSQAYDAASETFSEASPQDDATSSDGQTHDTLESDSEAESGEPYREPDTPPFASTVFGNAPGVIFRWRSDGTSTSPGQYGGDIAHVKAERPAPFSVFPYTSFSPSQEKPAGYLGTTPITTQSVGFTIQAWFRPRSIDGTVTLFSNTENGQGLCFDIKDGYLQMALSTSDAGKPYRHWVRDTSTPLETNRWYQASVSASLKSDHWRIALFLDHNLIHEQNTFRSWFGARQQHGTAGGSRGTHGGKLDGEVFDGDMHALVVHNYPIGDDYLGTRQLREGGRTFGTPSYHDYLQIPEPGGTATATPPYSDRRYNYARRVALTDNDRRFTGLRHARARLGLPFLNDRYVPNGVAVSGDGRTLWLSFSFEQDEGGNPKDHDSILAQVDLLSHDVQSVFRLRDIHGTPWTRAIGGMTWAPTGLYLTLGSQVLRFDPSKAKVEHAADPDLPATTAFYSLQATDAFDVRVANAAITYDPEVGALWLAGNVAMNGAIERYDLSETGAIERPSAHDSDQHLLLPPSIPFVRGLTRLPTLEERCFLLTSYHLADSTGSQPSKLIRWCENRPAGAVRWQVSGAAQALTLGPDATLWVVTQSGSAHLQKRKKSQPWYDVLTPYLIGFDASIFEPTTRGCITDAMIPLLGDLHTHTSYSDGTGLPEEMFALARDEVGLDFLLVTDHVEHLTTEEFSLCKKAAKAATQASFLGLCAFEIATNAPNKQRLGHANVFFSPGFIEKSTNLDGLYDKIAACDGCLAQINHPASTDFPWTGDNVVAKVDEKMALAELNGAAQAAARAYYFKLLDGGWHVAPTWNSDTHSMNPSAGGRRSGLFASALDEASIKAAITERRTFAGNTGNGGSLALDAQGCWMGVRLQGYLSATIHVRAEDAEVGFSSIVLRSRAGAVVHTFDCAGEKICDATMTLDIDPAQRYIVADATRTDGKWILSSPVWVED